MGYFENTTVWGGGGGGEGIMAAHDAHASSLPFSLLLFPLTAQTKRTRLKNTFSLNLLVPGYLQRTRPWCYLICLVCEKEFSQIRATPNK